MRSINQVYLVRQFIFILSFIWSISSLAQNFNRPVPNSGFPQYEFELIDSSFKGYYTFTARKLGGNLTAHMGILDREGYLVWFFSQSNIVSDFRYHPNVSMFGYSEILSVGIEHKLLTPTLNHKDQVTAPNGFSGDTHEFLIRDNGNAIIIVSNDTVVDLSGTTIDGQLASDSTVLISNNIMELDTTGNVVFRWIGAEHISVVEFMEGVGSYSPTYFDFMHMNGIDIDFDGHYLVSLRHTSSVLKIHKTTGAIIWRLGGNSSDFSFTNDVGFSANHHIKSLGNNRYSLYDNGNLTSSPKESRAVIFELDTLNYEATRMWEYRHSPRVYAPAMGNYHQTSNGFSLVNWGRAFRPEPTFTLIDSLNNPVSNMYLEDNWVSYRSYADSIPLAFDRPNVSCEQQSGQVILSAPASTYYLWSTGEVSQNITVSNPGTYQLWIDQGIGMVGSEPLIITDINNVCPSVDITEISAPNDPINVIYSLDGKLVQRPKLEQIYIVVYQSGKRKKLMWTEEMELR